MIEPTAIGKLNAHECSILLEFVERAISLDNLSRDF
jgi:hypothetical protein